MKKYLFLITFFCFSIICFPSKAKHFNLKSEDPPLSEKEFNHIKDLCKKVVRNYYLDLSNLTGDNIDKTANQDDAVDAIQEDCFRGPTVIIENNISVIAQDKLDVKSYLNSITVLSDKIDKISYNDNFKISNIYYNSTEHFYYIVASIEQKVSVKNDKEAIKIVDFYLNFNPSNNLLLKIYSIQNHTEGILNNQNIVQIISDQEAEKATNINKPYFRFDVAPINANIAIDGKTVFNDGSKIETTPGNHSIEILASNYQNLKFDIVASDTGVQNIVRALTLKHGYLFVNSADNSLQEPEVYIDSSMVGDIPLSNYQLGVGSHFIEIRGGGSFYKAYHVTITDENITTLNVQGASNARWEEKRNTDVIQAPANVSFQAFYDDLSPYGQWVEDPQYGNVFVPNVSSDFRPYFTDGHWAMTDEGNTWVSDEPWGWACYHYGRWTYNTYYNWVWVPGYEWAPAWVTWRFGDQACGWAPLSPGLNVDASNRCPDSWWVFVGPDHIYSSRYSNYWRGPENNSTYIRQTTIINTVNVYEGTHTRYNYGPSSSAIENVTHQPVHKYQISAQTTNPGHINQNGETVNIYRANLTSSSPNTANPASVIHATKSIDRPQDVSNINRPSNFRQDIQSNRLQSLQINNSAQHIQQIQQQRAIQQVQQQRATQQVQQSGGTAQQIQQQRAAQEAQQGGNAQQIQQQRAAQQVQQQGTAEQIQQQRAAQEAQQRGNTQQIQQQRAAQEAQQIQQQRALQQAQQQQISKQAQQSQQVQQQPVQQLQKRQQNRQKPISQQPQQTQVVQQTQPQQATQQVQQTQQNKPKQPLFRIPVQRQQAISPQKPARKRSN